VHTEREPTDGALRRAVAVARGVGRRTSDGDVAFLAAGVAYYAFVSLLPAAVSALVVAGSLGGRRPADAVVAAAGGVLTEAGQTVLVGAVVNVVLAEDRSSTATTGPRAQRRDATAAGSPTGETGSVKGRTRVRRDE